MSDDNDEANAKLGTAIHEFIATKHGTESVPGGWVLSYMTMDHAPDVPGGVMHTTAHEAQGDISGALAVGLLRLSLRGIERDIFDDE